MRSLPRERRRPRLLASDDRHEGVTSGSGLHRMAVEEPKSDASADARILAAIAATLMLLGVLGGFGDPFHWLGRSSAPGAASPTVPGVPRTGPSVATPRQRPTRRPSTSPMPTPAATATLSTDYALAAELGISHPDGLEMTLSPTHHRESAATDAAAYSFAARVREFLAPLRTIGALRGAGYRPAAGRWWQSRAALGDGRILDPTAPEGLIVAHGTAIGALFVSAGPPPTPAGDPLMRWQRITSSIAVCVKPTGELYYARPCHSGDRLSPTTPYVLPVWSYLDVDPFAAELPRGALP